nr:PREDICTED: phospholipase DDHD1-like [Bemisia tabaci]
MTSLNNGRYEVPSTFDSENGDENELLKVSLEGDKVTEFKFGRLSLTETNSLPVCNTDELRRYSVSNVETSHCTYPSHSDGPIEELRPEEIRWFYKNCDSKRWIEFCGYDSLQLEAAYRNLPRTSPVKTNGQGCLPKSFSDDALRSSFSNGTDRLGCSVGKLSSRPFKIVVRGGLYEVDLISKRGESIYWSGENFLIIRGSWLYENGQPLDEHDADIIESVHLKLFGGRKSSEYLADAKAPKSVLHTETFNSFSVVWYSSSPYEVYLYSQDTPSKIMRSFTQKLGGYFQKSMGYRLVRGYKILSSEEDKPADINHLVFVIHGIGQKIDTGKIIRNTSNLRESVFRIKTKYFETAKQRVEFFPVEWRSSLQLDGDIVEAITPSNVLNLRQLLNASAMDIMYYTSPLYSAEIQQGLTKELNRLYSMFVERNPNSDVKVSVVAHSLGCVIVYDIITGWMPRLYQEDFLSKEALLTGKSRLKFQLENFFCLGSPLAVFLALRLPQGHHGSHLFPPSLCHRLYNVFHPSDPVAYRLEPLVLRDFCKIEPYQIQPCSEQVNSAEANYLETTSSENQGTNKDENPVVSPTGTPLKERSWKLWNLVQGSSKPPEEVTSPQQQESPMEVSGLEHRLDFALKDNTGSYHAIRSYWASLTSHTSYWTSNDVAYFVFTKIFPDIKQSKATAETGPSVQTDTEMNEFKLDEERYLNSIMHSFD